MTSYANATAHMNGDCWPPACGICEVEDALAEDAEADE